MIFTFETPTFIFVGLFLDLVTFSKGVAQLAKTRDNPLFSLGVIIKKILLLSRNTIVSDQFKAVSEGILDIKVISNLSESSENNYDFIFISSSFFHFENFKLDDDYARSILSHMWTKFPGIKIFVFSRKELVKELASLVRLGANDYLTLPVIRDEIFLLTEDIIKVGVPNHKLDYLVEPFWNESSKEKMETKSLKMQDVYTKVRQVAQTSANVLLTGETGVGKNVIARLIHDHSLCKNKPFISVHCGAIPDSLIESELFGHEKGSFTDAVKKKIGKFELADGGTIFLDEVGTLTESAQIKILHVIQDSVFQRVGGETDVHINVRIIAATNADLAELVGKKIFREDLLYRLNVFPIHIAALRNRLEELVYFLDYFSLKYSKLYGHKIEGYCPQVLAAAKKYDWPGNIRELENMVERACILEKSNILRIESFKIPNIEIDACQESSDLSLLAARQIAVDAFEKEYFEHLLFEYRGKINTISKKAGIGVRQTHKLLSKHGLHADAYRKNSVNKEVI